MEPHVNTILLIDAYNVIRSNPSLAAMESRKGAKGIISEFVNLCWGAMSAGENWIVVFDGPGEPETREDPKSKKKLDVYFSLGITADEILVDKARYALSKGHEVILASSDFAIYEPGASKMSAFDFYDRLMMRMDIEDAPLAGPSISGKEILAHLLKTHHLPASFSSSRSLGRELDRILEYYGEELSARANKAAKKIEETLKQRTPLFPDPDPEKEINRTLKKLLRDQD
jgi:predicted RNA-binding protein with PIN domain